MRLEHCTAAAAASACVLLLLAERRPRPFRDALPAATQQPTPAATDAHPPPPPPPHPPPPQPPNGLSFGPSGCFKVLCVSDAHYNRLKKCLELDPERKRKGFCNRANTTAFLASVADVERPNLVAFVGDAIDENTRRPLNATSAMDAVYGVAYRRGLPWVATLGNHDHKQRWMSRAAVLKHITHMPLSLTRVGPAAAALGPPERPGNFWVDVAGASGGVAVRTWHFDADRGRLSYTKQQVDWFRTESARLPPARLQLAFGHVALPQYRVAASRSPVAGSWEEAVTFQEDETGLFDALVRAGVSAFFCGHDHLNDFCVRHPDHDIELCYVGSPGFTGYGKRGWSRRTRVLEACSDGRHLSTHLRLEDLSKVQSEVLVKEGRPAPVPHRVKTSHWSALK